MKLSTQPTSARNFLRQRCVVFLLLGCAATGSLASKAFATVETDLVSALGGTSLLEASVDSLAPALSASVSKDPQLAPEYIALLLKSRTDADAIAPQMTSAAIKALGEHPTPKQVGRIVYTAVKQTPDAVLEIVHATVLVTDPVCDAETVSAAVSAVPDPYKEVVYRKLTGTGSVRTTKAVAQTTDGKSVADGKQVADYKDFKEPAPEEGTRMPLSEAVARTVADARGTDPASLLSLVDYVLATGLDPMFDSITSSQKISGVGFWGDPNYANEPSRRTKTPGSDNASK